jgi:hypothetical protein
MALHTWMPKSVGTYIRSKKQNLDQHVNAINEEKHIHLSLEDDHSADGKSSTTILFWKDGNRTWFCFSPKLQKR